MQQQIKDAEIFLSRLPHHEEFYLRYGSLKAGEGMKKEKLVYLNGLPPKEKISKLIPLNDEGNHILVVINAGGQKASEIERVRAVFVDLDGSPLEPILKWTLDPHFVIETSPKRYHVYWVVEDGFPLEFFTPVQKALAKRFGGDDAVCDLPRLMRLPGFVHHGKEGNSPFVSRIIPELSNSEGQNYSLEQICEALGTTRGLLLSGIGEDNLPGERFEFPEVIETGQRDRTIFKLAASRVARGLSKKEVLACCLVTNKENCKPPLGEPVVKKCVESAWKTHNSKPENQEWKGKTEDESEEEIALPAFSDVDNANRLQRYFGADIRYVESENSFYRFDGKIWVPGNVLMMELAKQTIERARKDSNALPLKEELRRKLTEKIMRCENKTRITAMVDLLKSAPGIYLKDMSGFDQAHYVLNVENGRVDLRTGKLTEHGRCDYLTKIAPVKYDLEAGCPRWEQFLKEIFLENRELISFIQRAVGYCLTGDISERVFFVLWGSGANGKSVFIKTIQEVLGEDYSTNIPIQALTSQPDTETLKDLALLRGARFAPCAESREGDRLNESLVKQISGGEPVKGRGLYRDACHYIPAFKVWMSTNHKPQINSQDPAIWDRLIFVPFQRRFEADERDKGLADTLKAETSGILNWAIRGCLDWQRKGLAAPEIVRHAGESYREEQDVLAEFLTQRCVMQLTLSSRVGQLYDAYKSWGVGNGERTLPLKRFSAQLEERGFRKEVGTGNRTFFVGIGLREEGRDDEIQFLSKNICSGAGNA